MAIEFSPTAATKFPTGGHLFSPLVATNLPTDSCCKSGITVMSANPIGRLSLSGCSCQATTGEVAAPSRMEEFAEVLRTPPTLPTRQRE